MALRKTVAGVLSSLVLGAAAFAQEPEVHVPNFSVTLHAQVMTLAEDPSMAADRFGNVYIRNQSGILNTSGVIHKVDAAGNAPYSWFVNGLGRLSQIAFNPVDGLCYVAAHYPALSATISTVYRIDPLAGAVGVGTVNLLAEGFTIDDAGTMYFGASSGLYSHDPAGPAGNATFLSPGHAQNAVIQSLVSGDVLIAGTIDVRRWTPGSSATVPYYTDPQPTGYSLIQSLSRVPFNQIGQGALIGVRDLDTSCLCFNGRTVALDLLGEQVLAFATEPFAGFCETGLKAIASGPQQDQWWLTDHSPPVGPMPLYRIRQLPAPGSPGSTIAVAGGGIVTLDVYGPAAGGSPFLLGAMLASAPPASSFFASFGIVDLSPFSPHYLPVLDGVGLFGPPNPSAQIPVGGQFHATFGSPPALSGTSLGLQALIVSPATAPNGLFLVGNVEGLTLP
jgi:hypothetical protein